MANTYTQLYIHIVFAVKGRQSLIPKRHKTELHKYITGIITNKKQTVIQINSMPDHIHILVGLAPDIAVSKLVGVIKANSSKFINNKKWVAGKFEWQAGFGAFSYSQSHVDEVAAYIRGQEKHHERRTFQEEYLAFLKLFNVDYDERYIFDFDAPDSPQMVTLYCDKHIALTGLKIGCRAFL